MSNKTQLSELYEIAVFLRQQPPHTQLQVRMLHKQNEEKAIEAVRKALGLGSIFH